MELNVSLQPCKGCPGGNEDPIMEMNPKKGGADRNGMPVSLASKQM